MIRRLCIEVHDVAPATWPQCERLFALIDDLGRPPATLLAVPDFHGRGTFRHAPAAASVLRRRVDHGDEVALHGYFHRDRAPPPKRPMDAFRRRVLTAGEGEFSALAHADAARRIDLGRRELGDLFGPVRGFVAPAWLSSAGTWRALRDSPLCYAATRGALVVLDDMRRVPAPAITISARSRWRRAASRVWLRGLCRATAAAPIVRIALHPVDADHPRVLDDWRRALRILLDAREPVTKTRVLGCA